MFALAVDDCEQQPYDQRYPLGGGCDEQCAKLVNAYLDAAVEGRKHEEGCLQRVQHISVAEKTFVENWPGCEQREVVAVGYDGIGD